MTEPTSPVASAVAAVAAVPVPVLRGAEITWVASLAILAAYEVYALSTKRTTLSRAVWTVDKSQYGPLLPFLTGVLMGHFFFSGE